MKNLKINLWKVAAVVFMSASLMSCEKDDDNSNAPKDDIVDIATSNSDFDSLVVALSEAGLVSVFQGDETGPYTVFAPTNAAFVQLLSDLSLSSISQIPDATLDAVLKYHVVEGQVKAEDLSDGMLVKTLSGYTFTVNTMPSVTIDVNSSTTGINVTDPDILATNGVIHVIDAVLVPDTPASTPTDNIVDIATGNTAFDSLVVALTRANLVSTFNGEGAYTVFAPTNAAFVDLLSDLGVNSISEISVDLLTDVLTTHVVDGIVSSGQITNGKTVTTLSEGELTFNTSSGVQINSDGTTGSTVTGPDNWATNGIVHIIDEVLLPALP